MANFEVIAAVSETLRATLKKEFAVPITNPDGTPATSLADVDVEFLDVDQPPAAKTLSIFLYEVGEDPSARNHPRQRNTEPPDFSIRKPPMALLLRYLLTPWGGDQATQQKILARAMQVLYDRAILGGLDLQGVLHNTDEMLKLTLTLLSLEERARVWNAMQKAYRLSVAYEVRVVRLDSTQAEGFTPVTRRTSDVEGLENA